MQRQAVAGPQHRYSVGGPHYGAPKHIAAQRLGCSRKHTFLSGLRLITLSTAVSPKRQALVCNAVASAEISAAELRGAHKMRSSRAHSACFVHAPTWLELVQLNKLKSKRALVSRCRKTAECQGHFPWRPSWVRTLSSRRCCSVPWTPSWVA